MASYDLSSAVLERRRRELGMSRTALAERSGVSLATVQRILNGPIEHVVLVRVLAVSKALGASHPTQEFSDAHEFRTEQAITKANTLVALVQGSSGLEGQAVGPDTERRMVDQTVHELMAGPNRRLWG